MQREKNSVEDLNELSIVGDNDGNPEPRCSISNIIITTISVSLVSISYFLLFAFFSMVFSCFHHERIF